MKRILRLAARYILLASLSLNCWMPLTLAAPGGVDSENLYQQGKPGTIVGQIICQNFGPSDRLTVLLSEIKFGENNNLPKFSISFFASSTVTQNVLSPVNLNFNQNDRTYHEARILQVHKKLYKDNLALPSVITFTKPHIFSNNHPIFLVDSQGLPTPTVTCPTKDDGRNSRVRDPDEDRRKLEQMWKRQFPQNVPIPVFRFPLPVPIYR